ncbi:MAG: tyrosine-type recombinase/integrase [Bacteroidota bacterium]|nr:tyrosine-type recombinase/integrase [Bacteroidota bacterium]MDX5431321.1 tyrosine-type recombinase/integrase [Bacteroidota bacterium]MDX5470059.1 tyrosine-type recombinase/integrase [Bacteroidota bacterium]
MGTDFFFSDFLNYLERERKYSLHTLTAYRNDLHQFREFLLRVYEVDQAAAIQSSMVRSFIAEITLTGLSARSTNRKISSLKSFFRYALQNGILSENPMKKVVAPKVPKRLPVFVEQAKMATLLEHRPDLEDSFPLWRDYIVLELLYGTGIRLAEAIGLREKDLRLEAGTIKVLGKRNKERIIPIAPGLVEVLRTYLHVKQREGFTSDFVLLTNKGQAAYPKLIYTIVRDHLGTVSTLKKRSPHVLRHSYATHLLDNGAELNAIKELLGHSNLAATQVYTHNSIDRLKEVYRKAHPKS